MKYLQLNFHDENVDNKTRITTILLILIIILLMGCSSKNEKLIVINDNLYYPEISLEWGDILFSTPNKIESELEKRLIFLIEQAEESIDIAIYNLTLESITDSLIAAHKKGVGIRIIIDANARTFSNGEPNTKIEQLEKLGIPIFTYYSSGIMHHKFAIFDGLSLWTGSANFTEGGLFLDNNNVVIIKSPKIVQEYQYEFDYIWDEEETKYLNPLQDSTDLMVDAYFSQSEDVQKVIINQIEQAEQEILILIYSFTDGEIAQSIIDRYAEGVTIKGIFEYQGSGSNYSQMENLYCATTMIRTDGNENLMHHKVIIIDKKIVVTGSYNFSKNANLNNSENLLILKNETVANYFLNQFEAMWQLSQVLNPNWFECNN